MSWVVDSGVSFHITSHKEYFTSYTSGVTGQVRMGNSGSSTIVGKGTICIETNTGCRLVLNDVRHVPDIRLNLLSVGSLTIFIMKVILVMQNGNSPKAL
jgi:hypothetical protein